MSKVNYMIKKQKSGISLIVLAITIIVILILAGAILLMLSDNNPITQASKATYLSDVRSFQTELDLYKTQQFSDKLGKYNPLLLKADESSVTYDGVIDNNSTIYDLIPSLEKVTKYAGQFEVLDGELIFQGSDTKKQDWAKEIGVEVVIVGEPTVTIISSTDTLVKQGKDIVYTIKFVSNAALTTVDLAGKMEIVDDSGITLPVQPVINIGTVSGTNVNSMRQVDVTIKTDTLGTGSYKLKIKPGAVTNADNMSNTIDTISLIGFDIDNTAPENPIMSANPSIWTNGNVTVTITYSGDAITKEYSTDATNWSSYTEPILVTDNTTTVFARGKDSVGNISGVASLTVANIDKEAPTVTLTNGGSTTSSITVTATASDVGNSGINGTSYQYSKDNGLTWTSEIAETSYTFNTLTTGTYNCKVKVLDNAGNSATSETVAITTQELGEITLAANTTAWTNGDVTVTINYPSEAVTKQYSTDGTTWNIYSSPVLVSTNGTTVYAKGLDDGGNQIIQASLTVSNIDKEVPTITLTNGGTTTSSVTVTATASDVGGSGLVAASYQYSKDNGVTWTTASSATSYTFSTLTTGTYNCKVKVSDNAGNSTTSSAVALTTGALGTITMSANPTEWTNGNVTVTVTYPSEAVTKQYSIDGTTWNTYTAPVVVSTNGTTVYAKGLDAGSNQIVQQTLTVANIDKEAPTVTLTNGGTTTSSVTVTATASDVGGSGLVAASYQYSKDNGTTWTTASSATSYTFSTLTTGTYNCKVKVSDNAGNSTISSAVALTTGALGTITMSANPTGWTNGNVTVTVTYPSEAVTKQYSTDGTTWNTYTAPVVVSTNGTTVYAKGNDNAGNQITQALLTVSNIDKTVPTVTVTNGGTTTSSVTVTATASDAGGSGLVAASYQYSKDNGTTWTTASSATSYTFSTLTTGTYQCKAKVLDNAGNSTTSSAVALTTGALGTITMSANPTGWTNGNVTVTVTYPSEAVTKQYSTDGTTWNTYSSPVVVSTNNTTVYAKGNDAGGNQITQASITVTNIDKTVPTTPTVNLNGYTSGNWTTGNVTQTFSSTDAGSGIQKYQYTVDGGANWYDCPNPWTINWDGQWTFNIRSIDNTGNISSASASYIIRRDATAPTYSSYAITNVSSSGYDVYVYGVSDNLIGINRVQFPTWTDYNGQDDLASSWWSNSQVTGQNLGNGTWYFRVNISQHNNESGQYQTHIYMYDNAGNYSTIITSGANVPSSYSIANTTDQGYGTIRVPASTSNATELNVKGTNMGACQLIINNLDIKVGDTISVTYATSRSNNSWYIDLIESQSTNNLFFTNVLYSSNMVTKNKTYTAVYNANYYSLGIQKTTTSSSIYCTMYIYDITINGVKIL